MELVSKFNFKDEPEYHNLLKKFRYDSEVLNPGRNVFSTNVFDKTGIQYAISILVESQIPYLLEKMLEMDKEFENFQQKKVNSGNRKPKKMPSDMKSRYIYLQAQYDMANEELKALQGSLSQFTNKENISRNENILKYGLLCGSHTGKDDILLDIDGQKCSIIKGVLVIDEPSSPYDGMLVADYKDLAREWNKERSKKYTDLKARYDQEMRQFGKSDISVPSLSVTTVSRASLPKWPEGVTNYKKQIEVLEEII